MTFRHGPRSRGAAGTSSRAPRRVLSAFVLGFALSVAGLAALAAGVAGARGPFVPPDSSAGAADYERSAPVRISYSGYDGYSFRRRHDYDGEDYRNHRRHSHTVTSVIRFAGMSAASSGSQPVCVRLCDGFFFPLPTAAGDAASQGACNSLCPDAPTEVYYRNGAERIEDSVSASGKLYSSMPVSLRYRTTSDETCSCHRNTIAYAPLKDSTLKHGDAIMTPAGFMVFRGVEGGPHGAGDFAALDRAGLASTERGALQTLERASLTPVHPTLKDWLLSQNSPAFGTQASSRAPTQLALRAPAAAGGGKIRLMTLHTRDE